MAKDNKDKDYEQDPHSQLPENKFPSKKEEARAKRKVARRHAKALFNAKIGYRFQALGAYTKQNVRIPMKWIGIAVIILSAIMIYMNINAVVSGGNFDKKAHDYRDKTRKLQPEHSALSREVDQQRAETSRYTISNSAGVQRAYKNVSNVFDGMYNYNDSQQYAQKYKANMQLFSDPKADWVKNIYSNGKDAAGGDVISNLGLSSTVEYYSLYSAHTNDVDREKLKLKAIVVYHSYSEGTSGKFSKREHAALYTIDYNTKSNKITHMTKDGTLEGFSEALKASQE